MCFRSILTIRMVYKNVYVFCFHFTCTGQVLVPPPTHIHTHTNTHTHRERKEKRSNIHESAMFSVIETYICNVLHHQQIDQAVEVIFVHVLKKINLFFWKVQFDSVVFSIIDCARFRSMRTNNGIS